MTINEFSFDDEQRTIGLARAFMLDQLSSLRECCFQSVNELLAVLDMRNATDTAVLHEDNWEPDSPASAALDGAIDVIRARSLALQAIGLYHLDVNRVRELTAAETWLLRLLGADRLCLRYPIDCQCALVDD